MSVQDTLAAILEMDRKFKQQAEEQERKAEERERDRQALVIIDARERMKKIGALSAVAIDDLFPVTSARYTGTIGNDQVRIDCPIVPGLFAVVNLHAYMPSLLSIYIDHTQLPSVPMRTEQDLPDIVRLIAQAVEYAKDMKEPAA